MNIAFLRVMGAWERVNNKRTQLEVIFVFSAMSDAVSPRQNLIDSFVILRATNLDMCYMTSTL